MPEGPIDHDFRSHIDRVRKLRVSAAKLSFRNNQPLHHPCKPCEPHGQKQESNGDEMKLKQDGEPGLFSYSKGLSRKLGYEGDVNADAGEPSPEAYESLLKALHTIDPADFEKIPVTATEPGVASFKYRRLVNPQAGLDTDLEGVDGHGCFATPPPEVHETRTSREMGELYWMALLRDVSLYYLDDSKPEPPPADPANALLIDALSSLKPKGDGGDFSEFDGVLNFSNAFTRGVLFRGCEFDSTIGPYVSQFLIRGHKDNFVCTVPDGSGGYKLGEVVTQDAVDGLIDYGTDPCDQRQKTVVAGSDFMITLKDWRDVQAGLNTGGRDKVDVGAPSPCEPGGTVKATVQKHFIRTLRDMANYVHLCDVYTPYLTAALIMLGENQAARNSAQVAGVKPTLPFPYSPGNPYNPSPIGGLTKASKTQDGFVTFDLSQILAMLAEVSVRAHKAQWFQKWFVHRRLRPEEFGGRVHFQKTANRYPGKINEEILDVLDAGGSLGKYYGTAATAKFDTYLLPQAFPEGSPLHPAYGQGHAVLAGAAVTILKAFFDDRQVIPADQVFIVDPESDGAQLMTDPNASEYELTVGGELNKLAANIALGRDAAGVHWRSDYFMGLRLGERIAVSILQEQSLSIREAKSYNEMTVTAQNDFVAPYFSFTSLDGMPVIIQEGQVTPSNFFDRCIPNACGQNNESGRRCGLRPDSWRISYEGCCK